MRTLLPTALLLGAAWALAILIPKANGASLATVRLFNPDIGLALTLGAWRLGVCPLGNYMGNYMGNVAVWLIGDTQINSHKYTRTIAACHSRALWYEVPNQIW